MTTKNKKTKKTSKKTRISLKGAFTIIELMVVAVVLGIIISVTAVGFGQWRARVAETEVKNDTAGVQAGMEDYKNWKNSYPTFPDGTEFDGANDTKDIFVPSKNVRVTYNRGDDAAYCIDVESKIVSSIYLYLDTTGGNKTFKPGTCDGGENYIKPAQNLTVFVFDTSAPGCTGTVQLPIAEPASGGTIDWGDGSTQTRTARLQSHVYATPKVYIATFSGTFTSASYSSVNATVDQTNAKCLTKVAQWGNGVSPSTLNFYYASNLINVAEPPMSVTNMQSMFNRASSFNQPIGHWNTANVTNMSYMFQDADAFNQPIGNWNTANVTNMRAMLSSADSFNQPIGNWNTAKVTDMGFMLSGSNFNQPIGNWNTAAVTSMNNMFTGNDAFNQPIGSWNTSNVRNMSFMFSGSDAFNQPIGGWDTSKVTSMSSMFNGAIFNQPIDTWDTSSVRNMSNMFRGPSVFSQPINSWNTSSVTDLSYMFYNNMAFNQPLSSWDVSAVTNMSNMFNNARAFNQPIGSWNTSAVTNMSSMFQNADAFNQPIGSWNTSAVTNMNNMFYSANVFNQPINLWNVGAATSWSQFHPYSPLSQANCPPKLW